MGFHQLFLFRFLICFQAWWSGKLHGKRKLCKLFANCTCWCNIQNHFIL